MNRDRLLILLISSLLFLPFLGAVHLFDWDEINFAESAREMLLTGNWWQVTINFEPFREKPPLFFWMQALSMSIFGVGEFAARLPNALCGILTLQVIYSIGSKWQNRTFGWIWALLYIGSFLPFLYFKSGIIDPWFNLFIFLSIYHLFLAVEHKPEGELKQSILAGAFSGLSILTKGPVGFLLLLLTFLVYWLFARFKKPAKASSIIAFTGTTFTVSAIWFGHEWLQNGPWFIVEFIEYQIDLFLHPVAGHKQPFFYHFLVVLIGCWPMSIIALSAFTRKFIGDEHHLSVWMKYLFWVVLILFSIVTTKIVHYSSMTYLPLSYLAALIVHRHLNVVSIKTWQFVWIRTQGIVLAMIITILPLLLINKSAWVHLINDPFAAANLTADVNWIGWEWLPGIIFLVTIVISWRIMNSKPMSSFIALTLGTAFSIVLIMVSIVPKIEGYSQRAAIQFFEEHQRAKLETYKYKSYAHYFYGRVKPNHAGEEHFLVCKIQHKEKLFIEYPHAQHLYDSGGFCFFQLE
ncbi:MAG: glycosyltransferase family 39 protein [Flavobacteriales bacterium]